MSYTKGPWYADLTGRVWRRPPADLYENGGRVAGDQPIAVAHKGWETNGYPLEANARLIASAPDMLEALQAALPWLGGLANENDSVRDVYEQTAAAIKKATT